MTQIREILTNLRLSKNKHITEDINQAEVKINNYIKANYERKHNEAN